MSQSGQLVTVDRRLNGDAVVGGKEALLLINDLAKA